MGLLDYSTTVRLQVALEQPSSERVVDYGAGDWIDVTPAQAREEPRDLLDIDESSATQTSQASRTTSSHPKDTIKVSGSESAAPLFIEYNSQTRAARTRAIQRTESGG